jgi:hypothetical protein
VQRDGFGGGLLHVLQNRAVRGVERVRFGRDRKIDDGLRQARLPSGMPMKSTASRAAMQRASAFGSARPMSSTAMRTTRRAM